jgi:hypothetical protein
MTSPRWTIALGACACAAAGAYVFSVNPAGGGYPRCLFYETTGYYCAGCGATRALHALLHGRVTDALHDNALFVVLLPLALALVLRWAVPAWRENRWPNGQLSPRMVVTRGVALLAVAAVFMTVRNFPGVPFDWLRPLA